jgi:hypothetical protein
MEKGKIKLREGTKREVTEKELNYKGLYNNLVKDRITDCCIFEAYL